MASIEFNGKLKATNLFLIRHGESFNNTLYEIVWAKLGRDISDDTMLEEEAKLRQADCGLSDRGRIQASRLGDFVSKDGFSMISSQITHNPKKYDIYASPMKRCLQTSFEVFNGLKHAGCCEYLTVVPNLYESNGCFDMKPGGVTVGIKGSTSKDIEDTYPGFKCFPGMEDGWFKHERMETYQEFATRIKEEVIPWIWSLHEANISEDIFSHDNTKNVVIVAHGNVISAVINELLGGNKALFSLNNTGVTLLQLNTLDSGVRVSSMKYHNRIDHLLPDVSLLTGDELINDHWVQEYIYYAPYL